MFMMLIVKCFNLQIVLTLSASVFGPLIKLLLTVLIHNHGRFEAVDV